MKVKLMYEPVYFDNSEFTRLTPACDITQMSTTLLIKLDALRVYCGFALRITSAYRSKDWDLAKGRTGKGAHTQGLAVDIACTDSWSRGRILQGAFEIGFNGIGVGSNFIHLDIMPREYNRIVWTY